MYRQRMYRLPLLHLIRLAFGQNTTFEGVSQQLRSAATVFFDISRVRAAVKIEGQSRSSVSHLCDALRQIPLGDFPDLSHIPGTFCKTFVLLL